VKAKDEEPRWREAVRRSRSGGKPKPLAVVLPGIMGSTLKVTADSVWLNYWALMWGGLERLLRLARCAHRSPESVDFVQHQWFSRHRFIYERTDAILSGLHKDAWRILHLSWHGMYAFGVNDTVSSATSADAGKPKKCKSGMVIGKETTLTPGDVEQMRWVPELVFINCCHLGKIGPSSNLAHGMLAANLAM
jgi:hypothetical protein